MAVGSQSGAYSSEFTNLTASASGSGATTLDLERRFEEEFSQYVKEKTKAQQWQFGAVGVGVGGAIGLAVAPVVLPGVAVGGLIAGASGYGWARSKGHKEVKDGDCNDGVGPLQDTQRPTRRRLKYLVKWGHKQLLDGENMHHEEKALVIDEVVRAFSPWVQQLFLIRARGVVTDGDHESRNVFMHLMGLYYFLQLAIPAQVVIDAAVAITQLLNTCVVDAVCQNRCLVVFPTILEVISSMDRLCDATHAEQMRRFFGLWEDVSLLPRADRRGKLQGIVEAIHRVLDRQDFEETMSRPVAPVSPHGESRFGFRSGDGNCSDSEFYSCSDEEDHDRSRCPPQRAQRESSDMNASLSSNTRGCGHELVAASLNTKKMKDDPIQEHYKKTGLWGGFTGMFGDKKTMYCHHITKSGEFAVRAAGAKKFSSEAEVWQFLGKTCCGRYAYDSRKNALVCGALAQHDHDRTCSRETCLFCRNNLACPIPAWALKK